MIPQKPHRAACKMFHVKQSGISERMFHVKHPPAGGGLADAGSAARGAPARRHLFYTSLTSLNTRSFSPFRKWTMFSQLKRSKSSMAVVE